MNRKIKFKAWHTKHAKFLNEVDLKFVSMNTAFTLSEIIWLQYTGLKDKNGKEIYEGDIVLFPDEEREFVDVGIGVPLQVAAQPVKELGQVTFENGGFGFNCNRKSAYYEKGFSSFTLADFKPELNELEDIEIIGNIYENPELLTNN